MYSKILDTYPAALWRIIALPHCSWLRYQPWILSQIILWLNQASGQQHAWSYLQKLPTSALVSESTLLGHHIPWLFSNLSIHLSSLIEKVKKKISCISVYKYLSNHCYFDKHGFMFSCTVNSWIFLSNHFSISFLAGFQWWDITHLLKQISVPTTKLFVGLVGPNLSLELVVQNKTLHY